MVEKFIPGKELTTTIMDEQPLVHQILLQIAGMIMNRSIIWEAQSICSGRYSKKIYYACEDFALRAHVALGCGISRADFVGMTVSE